MQKQRVDFSYLQLNLKTLRLCDLTPIEYLLYYAYDVPGDVAAVIKDILTKEPRLIAGKNGVEGFFRLIENPHHTPNTPELIETMLSIRPDLITCTHHGSTPLATATQRGHTEIVEQLRQYTATPMRFI